jgi:hypothetical protein
LPGAPFSQVAASDHLPEFIATYVLAEAKFTERTSIAIVRMVLIFFILQAIYTFFYDAGKL